MSIPSTSADPAASPGKEIDSLLAARTNLEKALTELIAVHEKAADEVYLQAIQALVDKVDVVQAAAIASKLKTETDNYTQQETSFATLQRKISDRITVMSQSSRGSHDEVMDAIDRHIKDLERQTEEKKEGVEAVQTEVEGLRQLRKQVEGGIVQGDRDNSKASAQIERLEDQAAETKKDVKALKATVEKVQRGLEKQSREIRQDLKALRSAVEKSRGAGGKKTQGRK
jgi:predicted RNase H-like nuclease (RuvC/YqgF family)